MPHLTQKNLLILASLLFIFLSLPLTVYLVEQRQEVRKGAVYPYPPSTFTIQGYKRGCPEGTKLILDGVEETTEQPYYFYNVFVGSHTVSLEIPVGSPPYNISYSLCDCCINHPDNSFISGSSHRFTKEIICEGDYNYYDLYWQCKRKGDLDDDGDVDPQDLKILLENWGDPSAKPEADLNTDGVVNGLDFGKMIRLLQ